MSTIYWDCEGECPKEKQTQTVVLNIGGTKIETYLTTLERLPDSPLAKIAHYARRNEDDKKEIFMDRNSECFGAVVDFLRTGKLHYPPSVCGNKFRAELQHWGIADRCMEKCCINDYVRAIDNDSKLRCFSHYLTQAARTRQPVSKAGLSRFSYWRKVIWKTMMFPTYSKTALIYNMVALILLMINIMVILVQSVLIIQPTEDTINFTDVNATSNVTYNVNVTDDDGNSTSGVDRVIREIQKKENCQRIFGHIFTSTGANILFWMDVFFSLLFTSEIVVRCIVAPGVKRLLKSISTFTEFISLIPFYLLLFVVIHLYKHDHCPSTSARAVRILFILRVIRVFRLFFVMRHFCTFRAFMYTLKSSFRELFILFSLVTFTTIITGTLVSLIESAYTPTTEHSQFENILSGLWWALITCTTVGYGDLVPASPPARLLTVFVALMGIVVIALATPMVSHNFNLIYTYLVGNQRLCGPNKIHRYVEEPLLNHKKEKREAIEMTRTA